MSKDVCPYCGSGVESAYELAKLFQCDTIMCPDGHCVQSQQCKDSQSNDLINAIRKRAGRSK